MEKLRIEEEKQRIEEEYNKFIKDSVIVNDVDKKIKLKGIIESALGKSTCVFMHRGSSHGWYNDNVAARTQGKSGLLFIIKTLEGYEFGGYTSLGFSHGTKTWLPDTKCFLFSLDSGRIFRNTATDG